MTFQPGVLEMARAMQIVSYREDMLIKPILYLRFCKWLTPLFVQQTFSIYMKNNFVIKVTVHKMIENKIKSQAQAAIGGINKFTGKRANFLLTSRLPYFFTESTVVYIKQFRSHFNICGNTDKAVNVSPKKTITFRLNTRRLHHMHTHVTVRPERYRTAIAPPVRSSRRLLVEKPDIL